MFQNKISESKFIILFLVPFLLGSLSVLSFQPYNYYLINFFIFPSLFLLFCHVNKKSKNFYRKKPYLINLFSLGYFFGFGFFLAGNYWISYSLTFDESLKDFYLITLILIPVFLGIFFGLVAIIIGPFIKKNYCSLILFCLAFSLNDFIRSKIFTGFPWNLWAYSMSDFLEFLQIISLIQLHAFNLLVITIFTLPVILFFNNKSKFPVLMFAITIVSANILYGNYTINTNNKNLNKNENFINIKIISPNFGLKYFLDKEDTNKRLKKLIRYSSPDKDKKTIFIWPEGALSGKYFNELKEYESLIKKNFSKKHLIVIGINTLDNNGKFYNSLLIINNNVEKIFHYNKNKLVPFGEFVPFENFFKKIGFKKITEGFGSFSEGDKHNVFDYEDTKIVPLICYEIIFPELLSQKNFKKSFILNISEDGWFGDSIGPYQHFSKSIFRAIENNSYVVRSANKGISAFISNKGKIIKSLSNNEAGSIEYKLPVVQREKSTIKYNLIFYLLLITYTLAFLIFYKYDK